MGSGKITVSVVILTYGDYSGLRQTIDSVLKQDYPITELILSDDGSHQAFPQDILSFLQQAACPVRIRQGEKNLGTTAHLNLWGQQCKSDCIKFIGAGDAFSDMNALSALVDCMIRRDAMVVTSNEMVTSPELCCQYYIFPGRHRGAKLSQAGTELFCTLAKGNIISATGCLFRKTFFSNLDGFDETYRLLEDWPTWLRMAREGREIVYLDRVTCFHALSGVSAKNGNAFYSDVLCSDMMHCYEKEIFPERKRFCAKELRELEYKYDLLKTKDTWKLWKQYGMIHLRNVLKRRTKWCFITIKSKRMHWSQ